MRPVLPLHRRTIWHVAQLTTPHTQRRDTRCACSPATAIDGRPNASRSIPVSATPARSAPHPLQAPGSWTTTSSGDQGRHLPGIAGLCSRFAAELAAQRLRARHGETANPTTAARPTRRIHRGRHPNSALSVLRSAICSAALGLSLTATVLANYCSDASRRADSAVNIPVNSSYADPEQQTPDLIHHRSRKPEPTPS
jgi:hypothetical protein